MTKEEAIKRCPTPVTVTHFSYSNHGKLEKIILPSNEPLSLLNMSTADDEAEVMNPKDELSVKIEQNLSLIGQKSPMNIKTDKSIFFDVVNSNNPFINNNCSPLQSPLLSPSSNTTPKFEDPPLLNQFHPNNPFRDIENNEEVTFNNSSSVNSSKVRFTKQNFMLHASFLHSPDHTTKISLFFILV